MSQPDDIIVGTCRTMCSAGEVRFRIKNNLVHALECSEDTSGRKTLPNPKKMVKEYSRSAAGRNFLIHEQLRPAPVLDETVDYLLKLFEAMKKEKLHMVYSFVVDRLRAVRQDMVVQRITAVDSIKLLEKMIPFYVETEYACRTRECPFYDWKLHSTQMEDCFSTWAAAISTGVPFNHDILFMYFFRIFRKGDVRKCHELLPFFSRSHRHKVFLLCSAIDDTNCIRFFRLLGTVESPILRMSLSEFVHEIRLKSLEVFAIAFKSRGATLPLSCLENWLNFAPSEESYLVISNFFEISHSNVLICSFHSSGKIPPDVDRLMYTICPKSL